MENTISIKNNTESEVDKRMSKRRKKGVVKGKLRLKKPKRRQKK